MTPDCLPVCSPRCTKNAPTDDHDGGGGKRSRCQRITDPANIGHFEFDMNKPIIGPVTPVHILAALIVLVILLGIVGNL